MKLSALDGIYPLLERRDELKQCRALVQSNLGVTLLGKYQPEEIVGLVQPVVVSHFDSLIDANTAQLALMGVVADD